MLTDEEKDAVLELFDEDNDRSKKGGKRVNWKRRSKLIREVFPSVDNLDWDDALLQDFEVFGRVIRDIAKLDQAEPGRSGPRPGVDRDATLQMFRQMNRDDYTMLPFAQAFRLLATHRHNGEPWSYRQIAKKTHLSVTKVHKMLNGQQEPTVEEVITVAEAFGKNPSFFVEYRVEFVLAALQAKLASAPEASVTMYRNMVEGDRMGRAA